MSAWADNPAPALEAAFAGIARTRMADVPLCNPALRVEAVGFRALADGHWLGVMVTPWAINLLRLPGAGADWPATAAGGRHVWSLGSGDYEFIVAEEESLGVYHLCSLFSPALEFPDHAQARLTALAAVQAVHGAPLEAPPPAARPTGRRAFLGLGR
ncbi:[NiFe]-hydrogenase assembly chaperone HybE [Azonexus sp.]|uniref:[NiFe]-hydrogenase assembly chaperone HybE n=1 Tax=Azonexus sp. TaxID=1872668 RepID=UPI0035B11FB8